MTYNPSIPQPTDIPSQSQAQFLTNFTQLNTIFAEDHVTFNDASASNRGKHNKSTYVGGTDPTTAAGEIAVYSKSVTSGVELFMRDQSSGTVIQLSNGAPIATSNGSTFLPGGITMNWGSFTFSGTSNTITYATAYTSAPFSVVLTPINSSALGTPGRVGTTTLTGFTINTASSVSLGSWFYISLGT